MEIIKIKNEYCIAFTRKRFAIILAVVVGLIVGLTTNVILSNVALHKANESVKEQEKTIELYKQSEVRYLDKIAEQAGEIEALQEQLSK